MKFLILLTALIAASLVEAEKQKVKPQMRASPFTYPAGSTAAYPPATGLIYSSGTVVKYVAGTTATFYYNPVSVSFTMNSEFYVKEGPVEVAANTSVTFGPGTMVTFPPGTTLKYLSTYSEVRYQQFNGNSHTIVQYPYQTQAQYYCSNCDLILYQPGTNPLMYYNPGGSTRFGPSALPVEKAFTPTARTYGGYYGGGGGYNYCSGYSYNGYPQTTYYNYNTGYSSTCNQNGYGSYSYGGGGGGGYSMGGGSCYGGGSYYGSYGGSGYYGK